MVSGPGERGEYAIYIQSILLLNTFLQEKCYILMAVKSVNIQFSCCFYIFSELHDNLYALRLHGHKSLKHWYEH